MNIVLCMKQVPDTESIIKVQPDGSAIDTGSLKYVMNPYDEYGVEEALKIKEKMGEGTVTIVSMGPARAVEAIRMGLAMGADNAIHLEDPAFEGGDVFTAAKLLAEAIKTIPHDIIFCGKQAIDDDQSQVGPALAEFLGIPQVSLVVKMEITEDKKKVKANRQIEGGEEVIECPLPAVFACQKGLNEPRYASLPGIMKAKKKPLETKNLAALGLDAGAVGKAGSKTNIKKFSLPPQRKAGKIIEGETPEELAGKLVQLLREEAKAI